MMQTKRGILVLQVGCWAWGYQPHAEKHTCYETSTKASEWESKVRKILERIRVGTWNVRIMLRPGPKCRDRDAERRLRCRNWRRSAEDREAWKRRIEEARAQDWLQRHRWGRRSRRGLTD